MTSLFDSSKYLYRYRLFNENTINEIVTANIWHSKIKHLNDPFELSYDVDIDSFEYSTLAKLAKNSSQDIQNKIQQYYCAQDIKTRLVEVKERMTEMVNDYTNSLDQVGISCFSRVFDSSLMWSHYTDGMKGLCLVYDEKSVIKQELFQSLLDVNYVTTRPVIKLDELPLSITIRTSQTVDFSSPIPQYKPKNDLFFSLDFRSFNAGYSKHDLWKYEHEVRNAISASEDWEYHSSGLIANIGKESLKGIIVGYKVQDSQLELLNTLVKDRDIKLFVAHPNKKNYSVEISDISRISDIQESLNKL